MPSVLFVCVHNSGRSQMAEAFFKQLALDQAQAFSAGTQPADSLNPNVVAVMREIGISMDAFSPKLLTEQMITYVDRVITMGCSVQDACPGVLSDDIEDWGLADPAGASIEEIREIRQEIRGRVEDLLPELVPDIGALGE